MYVITTPDSAAASIGMSSIPNQQPTDRPNQTLSRAAKQHVLQLDLSPLSLSVVIVSQIVHAYRIKPNSSKSLIEIVLLFHRLQLLDFALLNFSAEHGYMS